MPKLTVKKRLQILLLIFVVCMSGIIYSTIMIDNVIDGYIDRISTNINLEINNNCNEVEVNVDRKDENIFINIDPKEEKDIEETFESREGVVISKIGINIRKEPSISSEKIGSISYGEKVIIIDEISDCYKIDSGFIHKEYVDIEFNS